jgi:excisionase family DNA binding protein
MGLDQSLTINEAAAALRVSYGTVRAAILAGRLRAYRFGSRGGTYRIDLADLEAYKASCVTGRTLLIAPEKNAQGGSSFKSLDGDRLLAAWRQQGVFADPPGERNAQSSALSSGPSAPKAS